MSTRNGYTSFFKRASAYDSEWFDFAGVCHKTPEDNNNGPLSDQPPQSYNNMRELHDNKREIHSIPFHDEDFEPLNIRPITSDFNIQWYKEHLE